MSESSLKILDRQDTALKFVSATLPVYRKTDLAEAMFESQKMEFKRAITSIKDWEQISSDEIYRVFIGTVATGLSWANEEKNFDVMPQNVKQADGSWVKALDWKVSYRGETSLRIAQNQIVRIDGPHCIYEGDEIIELDQPNNHIKLKQRVPRQPNAKVVGAYLFKVFSDGTKGLSYMEAADFDRLKEYSARKNKTSGANALYTSHNGGIDPGFAEAKVIKHAYRGLPKCKTLAGMKIPLASEIIDEEDTHETTWQEVSDSTPADSSGTATPVQQSTAEQPIF